MTLAIKYLTSDGSALIQKSLRIDITFCQFAPKVKEEGKVNTLTMVEGETKPLLGYYKPTVGWDGVKICLGSDFYVKDLQTIQGPVAT